MILDMADTREKDFSTLLRETPLLPFLFVGIVLTHSSLMFPQNLGTLQSVAGWPLIMYKEEFRFESDIDPTGQISRQVVPEEAKLMWNRIFGNILIWTVLLYGTWWVYEKSDLLKTRKAAG